jgi:hypothetical protein
MEPIPFSTVRGKRRRLPPPAVQLALSELGGVEDALRYAEEMIWHCFIDVPSEGAPAFRPHTLHSWLRIALVDVRQAIRLLEGGDA